VRLWSIHPENLDPAGLVAVWREALLAQAVLRGRTEGYRHHPQLERFREHSSPLRAVSEYLRVVWVESDRRGYRFDRGKFRSYRRVSRIPVPSGQLAFERGLLQSKLSVRSREWAARLSASRRVSIHPLFRRVKGPVAGWEKTGPTT
jgi:hypothetical protein